MKSLVEKLPILGFFGKHFTMFGIQLSDNFYLLLFPSFEAFFVNKIPAQFVDISEKMDSKFSIIGLDRATYT